MGVDVLAQVLLAPEVLAAWQEACEQAAAALAAAGMLGREPPPDETAEVQDDGSLLIRGQIGRCELSVRVPPECWAWAEEEVK